jgi:hypothetical protein
MQVDELAPGLWRWTARSPDWSPGMSWEPEVSCFYAETGEATVLVDPLVPEDEAERFWSALDRDVERRKLRVAVLLTQAAHARSAGEVAQRYGGGVWGHEGARPKVGDAPFTAVEHGDELPGGVRALRFDQEPGGSGTPLFLPSHGALAVGDVFISIDGELRVWWGDKHENGDWYAERLLPSLRRWLELPIERLLIAHGPQVGGGVDELAAALERPPHSLE